MFGIPNQQFVMGRLLPVHIMYVVMEIYILMLPDGQGRW